MSGIVLEEVSCALGGRPVLSGLSLRLTEPRIGIVGRNGSGKTTLLRLIAGLIAPASGRVRVDGIDPFADRKGALARLGILFQNPDHQILFPTVEEELAFGLRQQGQPQAQAWPPPGRRWHRPGGGIGRGRRSPPFRAGSGTGSACRPC